MTRQRIAGWALLAVAGGIALGVISAPKPGRPAAVERALKAVDRDDAAALASALKDAGSADEYPSPWREELAVATAVSRGDFDALQRIGVGDRGAPAARALLYISEHGRSAAEKSQASERLRADYPSSWVTAASSGAVPKGPR